ncbi:hypothetical protein K0M31_008665 [Melipona bicolor]|uniref:Uncharacterized protein n=1 Tax=Melipona bicolor TaxID=60889 RepID=A0AA40KJS8_9HYME|nr:hypothetical protein K0M31_008665 [Melipona bicolor]
MTISTYTKPQGFFNIGLTAGQAWQLPSKSTLSNKLGDYHRRSRRQLYRKMELLLERTWHRPAELNPLLYETVKDIENAIKSVTIFKGDAGKGSHAFTINPIT